MRIVFYKYQGAGNDFIIIDDRSRQFPQKDNALIRKMCDRHFGIGADGLMLLRPADGKDFSMLYFNSDGHEGTMCGNGGRCLVSFAKMLGLATNKKELVFDAIDGEHRARILADGQIFLQMKNVPEVRKSGKGYLVDTGSLHHVEYVDNLVEMDVYRHGSAIRRHKMYDPAGCNVNFIQSEGDSAIRIRTYERGVENETLACGTGSVAAAIVHHHRGYVSDEYHIAAQGGDLSVRLDFSKGAYRNIWLTGPATFVFKGEWK